MAATKNIDSVNFKQLEELLKYAVIRVPANQGALFGTSDFQYFLTITNDKHLRIYDAIHSQGTDSDDDDYLFDSQQALDELDYLKEIEYNESTGKHKITRSKGSEYEIPDVKAIATSEVTSFLSFIQIDNTIYKLTRDWADLTGKPATFPPSAHNHVVNDITDWPSTFPPSAHTHQASEVNGLATVATTGAYNDLTGKPVIPTIPVEDVQVNGVSVVDPNTKIANITAVSSNIQDLTSITSGILDSTAWSSLNTNGYYMLTTTNFTGLDDTKEWVRIKLSINSENSIIKITKNNTSQYSGLFFKEEDVSGTIYVYELRVHYNGSQLFFTCSTITSYVEESNFELSNGDTLVTSDGKVFVADE